MYHKDTKQLQKTLRCELWGDSGVWMEERAQTLRNHGMPEEAAALYSEFSQGPELEHDSNKWSEGLELLSLSNWCDRSFCLSISIDDWQSHAKAFEKDGITSQPLRSNNGWHGHCPHERWTLHHNCWAPCRIAITRDDQTVRDGSGMEQSIPLFMFASYE